MRLFDAHTHLNDEDYTQEAREEAAQRIAASDVAYIMDPGSDLATSRQALADAHAYSWCYAAVGYHPHEADHLTEEILAQIREMTKDPKVKAVGEIGLDFHYDLSDRENQRYWFRRQLRMANELHMPIMIHTRDADQETMDILKEEGAFSPERKSWFPKRPGPEGTETEDARVLLHCYSGSAEMAEQYVKLGATISICGPVTSGPADSGAVSDGGNGCAVHDAGALPGPAESGALCGIHLPESGGAQGYFLRRNGGNYLSERNAVL